MTEQTEAVVTPEEGAAEPIALRRQRWMMAGIIFFALLLDQRRPQLRRLRVGAGAQLRAAAARIGFAREQEARNVPPAGRRR